MRLVVSLNEYDPVVNEDKLARSISLDHYQQNRILEIVTLIHLQNELELVENVVNRGRSIEYQFVIEIYT